MKKYDVVIVDEEEVRIGDFKQLVKDGFRLYHFGEDQVCVFVRTI